MPSGSQAWPEAGAEELARLLEHLGLAALQSDDLQRHYLQYNASLQPRAVNTRAISLWLTTRALRGGLGLRVLDLWTRLFDPRSLLRFKLVCVLAMTECHPERPAPVPGVGNRAAWLGALCWAILELGITAGAGFILMPCYLLAFTFSRRIDMTDYYRGKRVLVTGASRGLGRELVRQLAEQGAEVHALARSKAGLEAIADESEGVINIVVSDVSDREATRLALEELTRSGPLDVAILNAGIKHTSPQATFTMDETLDTLSVNVGGVVHCLDGVLPGMVERGVGRVALVSSLGRHHGMARAHGYNASKAAVSTLGESLGFDLWTAESGVTMTVVEPGFLATEMGGSGLIARTLSVSTRQAAAKILAGVARGQRLVSFPPGTRLLTWILAGIPRRLAWRILSRARG